MGNHLGDSHNFGRRVTAREGFVVKPRTLLWESLLLAANSPLRTFLADAAARDGLGPNAFDFLPNLEFRSAHVRNGGEVERIHLEPLPALSIERRRELACIVGRSLALWSWLGVADLHWENIVIGIDGRGQIVFAPLDIEMILADLSLPTETKLLPDADPEVAAICRHAAGVRRVLPYLGKPVDPGDLVAMASTYGRSLAFFDRHAREIANIFDTLPQFRDAPIRVCLRGTDEYVQADSKSLWPPLLDAETEQLERGDIPYFFRLYDRPGIHYFSNPDLTRIETLPLEGDVPQLDPILQVSRGFRSPSRKKLREDGLFTVLGAFDHKSFKGTHTHDGLEVTFRQRSFVVKLPDGEELETGRNLSAFVGSVYLPCRCGEVLSVFVPKVTQCEAIPR
ncbi:MAG: hypothetical protein IPM54_30755 [Polyangiaceae bacterium]|nr:hypothetical protein [Polyangiaceae bacterium]